MVSIPATIQFKDTGYFSKMMVDYLDRKPELSSFYNNFPDLEGFENQLNEKGTHFPPDHREVLCDALRRQYNGVKASKKTSDNLDLLREKKTYTITTGHQLNLFTGPLYFLYKITSVINLCETLKDQHPDCNFVPVFWMASEDHDFDEICFFNFKGSKISWNREASGPVGRLSTDGLDECLKEFEGLLGSGRHAKGLISLFKSSYLESSDLAQATRHLANALFGAQGLVIVDGDDRELKRMFGRKMQVELTDGNCFTSVMATSDLLAEEYHVQVNPREINLFYIKDGLRERIVHDEKGFAINNTDIKFSRDEILSELEEFPERFSPNALMRPLYQETILPNLCYTGGGGELAYWMQLKDYFKAQDIPFPILLLRNSVLLIPQKSTRKMQKLDLSIESLFKKQKVLLDDEVKKISEIPIDFSQQRHMLKDMFSVMKGIAERTDQTFNGAVLAQEKKQLNGLNKLEKRLLKAQKRKHADRLERVKILQDDLFPGQSLQERQLNFSEVYEAIGPELIDLILDRLDPLKLEFDLITV